MYGGGVGQPHGARLAGLAYVDPATRDGGLGHPGLRGPRHQGWRVRAPRRLLWRVTTHRVSWRDTLSEKMTRSLCLLPGPRPFCLISNKFIKNLNLNIYLMILILYYKY
jgi:hypothetical protein